MPKIIIQNLNNQELSIKNEALTLLDAIHSNDIDWMHACGKKGRCTTCKAIVIEGIDNISPITAVEQKYLDNKKLATNERLTCQCKITGDVIVQIPEESELPQGKPRGISSQKKAFVYNSEEEPRDIKPNGLISLALRVNSLTSNMLTDKICL